MSRTRDEAQVGEARRLYGLGLTTYAIAAHLRVDPRTVQRWLADVTGPRGPRPRADVRDSLILDLRNREALSFAAIGRRVHMSPTGARMRYYALTGRERPERTRETAAPVGLPPGPSAALLSLLKPPNGALSACPATPSSSLSSSSPTWVS